MAANPDSSISAAEAVASSAADAMITSEMPFDPSEGSGAPSHHIAHFVGEAFSAADSHFKELGLDEAQIAAAKDKVVAAAQQKVAAAEIGPMALASEIGPLISALVGQGAAEGALGAAEFMAASEIAGAAELLAASAEAGPSALASSEMPAGISAAEATTAVAHVRRWRDELSMVLDSL
jgi:hypothetical protein